MKYYWSNNDEYFYNYCIDIKFLPGCKTDNYSDSPPNIIIIYTDEISGYGDVSASGRTERLKSFDLYSAPA